MNSDGDFGGGEGGAESQYDHNDRLSSQIHLGADNSNDNQFYPHSISSGSGQQIGLQGQSQSEDYKSQIESVSDESSSQSKAGSHPDQSDPRLGLNGAQNRVFNFNGAIAANSQSRAGSSNFQSGTFRYSQLQQVPSNFPAGNVSIFSQNQEL